MAFARYQRIYNASRNDRALTYAWFFFMFTVHTAFCTWAAISPPLPIVNDWAHTGFITAVKAFDKNTFTGVVYIIGGVFWSVEALWDVWCLKSVSFLLALSSLCASDLSAMVLYHLCPPPPPSPPFPLAPRGGRQACMLTPMDLTDRCPRRGPGNPQWSCMGPSSTEALPADDADSQGFLL